QRARVAGVAREHRALDRLGQVDEGEDGPVEVGEMLLQELALGGGEFLGRIPHAGDRSCRGGGGLASRMYRPRTVRGGVEFSPESAGYGPHPADPALVGLGN